MRLVTLLENTARRDDLRHAHGLSLYVETTRNRILFDMGPNDAFLVNAERMGVDLTRVDLAFLSHGHSDHGGGLELFCRCNSKAKIYMSWLAFGSYYAVEPEKEPVYIGLDQQMQADAERFCPVSGVTRPADGLTLFSDVTGDDYHSSANDKLREKHGAEYPKDAFRHEQNLLIEDGGKTLLLAGCAHKGIVNILRRAEELLGRSPDAVCAGFHLYNPGPNIPEPPELVEAVGRELAARRNTIYYTGHCTGETAFCQLKPILGDRLRAISTGADYTI
jgi:7,8-dihydropterin-6-yl-methyl-4-(beta-D-ribofuranosyl)aminobenzene 5'-phosphate synthase